MIRALLYLPFLLLLPQVAVGQKVHFTDSGNSWKEVYFDWSTGSPSLNTYTAGSRYGSDTLIAGVRYRQLQTIVLGQVRSLAVREDISAGKVYCRIYGSQDTVEHLLYDYNLKAGDTVHVDNGPQHFIYPIVAVDSVQMGGIYYKRWQVSGRSQLFFIEGIGTNHSPDYPIYPPGFEQEYQLRCFENNGQNLRCSPGTAIVNLNPGPALFPQPVPVAVFDNDSSCMISYLSPKSVSAFPEEQMLIAPNPGGIESMLSVPEAIGAYTLYLYELSGKPILSITPPSGKVNIGRLAPVSGTYFFRIQPRDKSQSFYGRFTLL